MIVYIPMRRVPPAPVNKCKNQKKVSTDQTPDPKDKSRNPNGICIFKIDYMTGAAVIACLMDAGALL